MQWMFRRRWLYWAAILFLLWMVWESARLALSSALATQVYVGMNRPAAQQNWQELSSVMGTALALNAENPDYRDVDLMLQYRSAGSTEVSDAALAQYREMVQQRPAWPYVWLNLLQAKTNRAEFDGEYQRVWNQLLLLAPWVKEVNAPLLHAGLRHWTDVSEEVQQLILQGVRNGLVLHPVLVSDLAKKYQRLEVLCAELNAAERAQLSCSDDVLFTGFVPGSEPING